jgi:hypothetical protein
LERNGERERGRERELICLDWIEKQNKIIIVDVLFVSYDEVLIRCLNLDTYFLV